ncbi:MAG: class I SAM-dependent methyltransferase [Lewinellaceae bacterium]|nr:class I SAM-dependent methyltransferase [Lewinellaceae bacterium]
MSVSPVDACPLCNSNQVVLALQLQDYSITREAFQLYDCQGCGIRFTHPVPEPADLGRYYQSEDYISHSDTQQGLINRLYHWARGYMLERKRALVESFGTERSLLDVGSGTGYFMAHLRDHGFTVLGVEMDEGARTYAQERFQVAVLPPEELEQGNIPGQFGVISMWHVLEHVYQPDLYLDRLREKLLPNGVLLIAVPNYTSYDATYYGAQWAAYDVPRHLWHFSPERMRTLAAAHGLQVVGQQALPLDPFYVAMLSEKYRSSGLPGLARAAWVGLLSSWQTWRNRDRASSLVYILRIAKG